ncbi:pyrimidine-nucleoside phosphorylase, partial [Klebsiella variicola]
EDLTELVLTLGSHMVVLAKKAETLDKARENLLEVIHNGKALEKFKVFLENQGGDGSVVDDVTKLPQGQSTFEVKGETSGYVSHIVADEIGVASMLLGAGRATKDDIIDLAVGLVLNKKVGDEVEAGESLVTIYANQEDVKDVEAKILENITISDEQVKPTLIHKVITD